MRGHCKQGKLVKGFALAQDTGGKTAGAAYHQSAVR
jgi:hypothetical protein